MPAVEADTWEVAALEVVGQDAWPQVREAVATLVDRFIQAYRAVNPEPAARPEPRRPSRDPASPAGRPPEER
jgi:hypothetical protein